jgi:hypothetical protein
MKKNQKKHGYAEYAGKMSQITTLLRHNYITD